VRLLFDNNLSPRLVERTVDVFPGAEQVARIGLCTTREVEALLRRHAFAIARLADRAARLSAARSASARDSSACLSRSAGERSRR